MNNEYASNQDPKVGDRVVLKSGPSAVYTVISVLGGRQGNKIQVRLESQPASPILERYYYCFQKA